MPDAGTRLQSHRGGQLISHRQLHGDGTGLCWRRRTILAANPDVRVPSHLLLAGRPDNTLKSDMLGVDDGLQSSDQWLALLCGEGSNGEIDIAVPQEIG